MATSPKKARNYVKSIPNPASSNPITPLHNHTHPNTKTLYPDHSGYSVCRFICLIVLSCYATGREVKLLSRYCIITVTSVLSSSLSFWQSALASCV